ncbi:hypothetical protein E4U16_003460 [Claviceps sp. LM84 group G4]|nr:hypothetical protein E4U16_003460 [Claviceps sp. LM84 group G4]
MTPPFEEIYKRRGYLVEPPASEPSEPPEPPEPSEPMLTGNYLAVNIVDTELSTLGESRDRTVCRMSTQIVDVVGQRKALLLNIVRTAATSVPQHVT